MNINDFLSLEGVDFNIFRNSQSIGTAKGLLEPDSDPSSKYISFDPNADIQVGDTLIHPSGKSYSIIETDIEYFSQVPYALKAYYEKSDVSRQGQTFNINSVHGSFIGNTSHSSISYTSNFSDLQSLINSSDSPDKEQLHLLVEELREVLESIDPSQKKRLSRFGDALKRNSWFTTPLVSAITNWLTSRF